MLLSDVYNQLTYGELAQVFVTTRKSTDTGLTEAAFIKLFPLVQSGLTDMHSRMFLREGNLSVPLTDALDYIIDPEAKDLLEIEQIEGIVEKEPYIIPLDIRDNPESIRRIATDTIKIPVMSKDIEWRKETQSLNITYRANHPYIKDYLANAAPLITPIYLPQSHLHALCLGIAARYMDPIGMKNEFHSGRHYLQKYEAEMQRLEMLGFDVQGYDTNTNLTRNGWA